MSDFQRTGHRDNCGFGDGPCFMARYDHENIHISRNSRQDNCIATDKILSFMAQQTPDIPPFDAMNWGVGKNLCLMYAETVDTWSSAGWFSASEH